MRDVIIKSRKNPLAALAREVRDGRRGELIFIEGVRLCEEAARARLRFEAVLCAEGLAGDERGARLLGLLRDAGARISPASGSVLESVSDTKTTQGVVALAGRPRTGRETVEAGAGVVPLVVVMHRANNPSNAGAMLRVAEAAGATAVISTRGSADLFSPKSLRGSMGSAFRLPVWDGAGLEEALEWCAARGIRPVAAAAGAAPATHTETDWKLPRAVVVGPEAGGLSPGEISAVGEGVRVPMREPVESLNVAVALAVLLYEAARQRGG